MLVRVPTVKTNFSVADFIKAAIRAWYSLYNKMPSKRNVAVLYAQWSTETGIGSFCWNYNIGNIKAIDTPGTIVEYCALQGVWEIVNGKKIMLKAEDPGSWFRAFPSLALGMEFYFNFLRNKRYKTAWTAVEQGDPALFSHLLRQAGYYTAAESDYTRVILYHFNIFMRGATFDKMYAEVEQEIAIDNMKINFPADYTPLVLNTKEDTFDKVNRTPDNKPGLLQTLKNFFSGK